MAILASDLKRAMAAVLGTAGTQRYLDQQHYIPAIQAAERRFGALVGSVFAENKGGEELFREITETRVFQTNTMGGVTLTQDELGHRVWSISAIYPEPLLNPADAVPLPLNDDISQWRQDITMRRPGTFPCERITLEEAAITQRNRFRPGNERLAAGPRRSYSYYIVGDRSSTNWQPGDIEVVVNPESITGRKLVIVSYLKGVDEITSMTDSIPYPAAAFQLLRDLALNEISIRQGAQPLFNVTINEVKTLLFAQA